MLKVWGRRSSSNVQVLLWGLEELELTYERVDAGFTYGVVKTPEYLAMNPNATVPTLQDGSDPVIYESAAILRYICTRYASAPFWPDNLVERTNIDKWAEWSKVNVAMNFTSPIFWRLVRTAPSKQDKEAIARALETLNVKLAIADKQLAENEYLAGEHLTLADIQLGHVLFRYFDIELERQSFPHLQRYYSLLNQRPHYQNTVMHSYEELRVLD